jgi:hypothetical protein
MHAKWVDPLPLYRDFPITNISVSAYFLLETTLLKNMPILQGIFNHLSIKLLFATQTTGIESPNPGVLFCFSEVC